MSKGKTEQAAQENPAGRGRKAASTDYRVGYGRPPQRTRFTKGQSGNPTGRPKGGANAKTIVSRAINEKVTIREGDKARDMTKLEGLLQAHLVKAIKGDARSASLVIGLVAKLGLFADVEQESDGALSEEDRAILAEYVQSQTGAAGISTPTGSEN
jgi:Family of unknown function (DUF5681)